MSNAENRDRFWPVLAAIGTGIGVVGFVAFMGGAILWARFDELELPPEQAVAAVPQTELIVIGAGFLSRALLIALFAVAFLYLYRSVLITFSRRRQAQAENQAEEAARSASKERREELEAEAEAMKERVESGELPYEHRIGAAVVLSAILLIGGLIAMQWFGRGLGAEAYVVLAGISLLTVVLSAIVLVRTNQFLWYGVAVLFSVAVFIAAHTYFRTTTFPKFQPVAVLLDDGRAALGVYVAETSDELVLGDLNANLGRFSDRRELLTVPRETIGDFTVGPLASRPVARADVLQMGLDLCRSRRQAIRAAVQGRTTTPESAVCPTTQVAELQRKVRQLHRERPGL